MEHNKKNSHEWNITCKPKKKLSQIFLTHGTQPVRQKNFSQKFLTHGTQPISQKNSHKRMEHNQK